MRCTKPLTCLLLNQWQYKHEVRRQQAWQCAHYSGCVRCDGHEVHRASHLLAAQLMAIQARGEEAASISLCTL
eukprot:1157426-Pelagomonas_calceolata.AAC.8